MMFEQFVSNHLRAALREHGWAKLAHQVIYAKGGFPPEDTTIQAGAKALCMKLAVDMVNKKTVDDGVRALKELRHGR
jgi:hypothetical protein